VRFELGVDVAALEARDGYVSDISRALRYRPELFGTPSLFAALVATEPHRNGCGRHSSVPYSEHGLTREQAIAHEGRSFELGYADDYRGGVDEGWQNVEHGILDTPGALEPAVRRAIFAGQDPPELAPLLDKVRRHAYRITDDDVAGLEPDVVIEAALAAALGEALRDRQRALAALG
jgi:hypothetical protein